MALWLPSQNGFSVETPHRHRATVLRRGGITSPVGVRISKGPRTSNGPFGYAVMLTGSSAPPGAWSSHWSSHRCARRLSGSVMPAGPRIPERARGLARGPGVDLLRAGQAVHVQT